MTEQNIMAYLLISIKCVQWQTKLDTGKELKEIYNTSES
jgi:hypothetical protein